MDYIVLYSKIKPFESNKVCKSSRNDYRIKLFTFYYIVLHKYNWIRQFYSSSVSRQIEVFATQWRDMNHKN